MDSSWTDVSHDWFPPNPQIHLFFVNVVLLFLLQVKHQTRVSYKCAAAGCEFMSLEAADMRRHMALEHVLVVKNKDGTGMTDEDETLS